MDWILREHFTCYRSKPGTQQIYIINLTQMAGMESEIQNNFPLFRKVIWGSISISITMNGDLLSQYLENYGTVE